MNAPQRRGRPQSSKSFRLVPVPHATPQHRKVGKALLALALQIEQAAPFRRIQDQA
mgnify:CR=1 FL=1